MNLFYNKKYYITIAHQIHKKNKETSNFQNDGKF